MSCCGVGTEVETPLDLRVLFNMIDWPAGSWSPTVHLTGTASTHFATFTSCGQILSPAKQYSASDVLALVTIFVISHGYVHSFTNRIEDNNGFITQECAPILQLCSHTALLQPHDLTISIFSSRSTTKEYRIQIYIPPLPLLSILLWL